MIALEPGFLRGSYPPLVTPFRGDDIDWESFAALVERQVEGGSHGILVCGTTAEPSTLTVEERCRLVRLAVEVARGRLPVVAATGSQSHAETVALSRDAERAGADALLIVTPYYIRPSQRGLFEYYRDIAARTDLPWMVYNIPGRTAVGIDVDTLVRLAEVSPALVGIKHAVNDLGFAGELLRRLGFDFRLFVGLEELSFPMLALGAAGVMNAVGNLAPRRVAELCEAVAAGDLPRARRIHYGLLELSQAIFYDTNPVPLKAMMKQLGLLERNDHRLPMVPASPELERRLGAVLARAEL
jgi:4-hydroxy-tetrahydrodipicolinate synthase